MIPQDTNLIPKEREVFQCMHDIKYVLYLGLNYFETSCFSPPTLREWYHPAAIMLTGSFTQRLLTALYDLSDVTFDLPREGLELDETWPAFVV